MLGGFDVALALGLLLGVLPPLVGRLERGAAGRLAAVAGDTARRKMPAVIEEVQANRPLVPTAAAPRGFVVCLLWLPWFGICAAMPLAGVSPWQVAPVSWALADSGASLLAVLGLLGVEAALLAAVVTRPDRARGTDAVAQVFVESLMAPLTLGVAVVGLVLVSGTWQLSQLVVDQDASVSLASGLVSLGVAVPWWLQRVSVSVPTWGVFLQPGGFAISLACVLLVRLGSLRRVSRVGAGAASEEPGGQPLRRLVLTGLCLIASLLVSLFFGGWSVPWLPMAALLAATSPSLGPEGATVLCLVLQVVTFGGKVLALVWLLLWVESFLPRVDPEQSLRLFRRVLLPLALVNVAVTAALVVALEDVAR